MARTKTGFTRHRRHNPRSTLTSARGLSSTQPKSVTSGFGRASGFLPRKNPGSSEKGKDI